MAPSAGLRRAVFLDRDGVINRDKAYVHQWADFEFVPGAMEAMRQLKAAGFALVVVTNQSGIARGMYSPAQYETLTARMCEALAQAGASPDGVYHCPHHPAGKVARFAVNCACRKPAPGLILRAAQELRLSLTDSIMVGDKPSDIEAARAAGIPLAYKVRSDNDESATEGACAPDGEFADLSACVAFLMCKASDTNA
jgi:D-glycero-D-manno-heptose 1,7-bisphosphate phosphatase